MTRLTDRIAEALEADRESKADTGLRLSVRVDEVNERHAPSEAITLDQVNELYAMLTGVGLPLDYTIKELPMLSADVAFSVIWFLQERLRVIPDHYELCDGCKEIYDSNNGGAYEQVVSNTENERVVFTITSAHYCECCDQGPWCDDCGVLCDENVPLPDRICPFCVTGISRDEEVFSS